MLVTLIFILLFLFSSSRFAPRRLRPCFLSRSCRLIHPVKVTLESVHMGGPESAELSQPVIQFLKWLGLQSVKTSLRTPGGPHKTGPAQPPRVLGPGRRRHTQPPLDLSHRLL